MNYKDTLRLPKTDFPLNLKIDKEQARYPELIKVPANAADNLRADFVLHDGPPYANGDIHVGHALNKILKDFVVRRHSVAGRTVQFTPGWDCHGLPIELKQQGDSPLEIRKNCRQYALEQVERQKAQFKTLGVAADWDNPYLTLSPDFELNTYKSLVELLEKGLLYPSHKPVFWSWKARTALAEAEIEYKDVKTESAYVCFPTNFGNHGAQDGTRTDVLVWTTTPWTLPSNVLVAAGKCNYCRCKTGNNYVLVAENRVVALQEQKVIGDVVEVVQWEQLKEIKIKSPLSDRHSMLIFTEVEDKGTGFVHIAPGHGQEDYQLTIQRGIKHWPMPVGPDGCYTESVNALVDKSLKLEGVHVFDGNKIILEYLNNQGLLACTRKIEHSYPYCSRTETPIIFRSTEQWFLKLYGLEQDAVKSLKYTKFETKDRLLDMITNRPDWCVSRQRSWGVPLAFFKHKGTGNILCNFEQIIKVFEEKGVDAWWSEPVETFLPEGENPDLYDKVMDVLDVWFDSGLTWQTLNVNQANLYFEGNDQHRGWFQSSLWLSVGLRGIAPYEQVISHGFVVDGNGQKMAKSKGNVVNPLDVVKKYGAEVLRYWVATTDYKKEIRCNNEILNRASEGYKKLRNTLRFLIANIDDTTPKEMPADAEGRYTICPEDVWMLIEFQSVFESVDKYFREFNFHTGMSYLVEFVNTRLSNVYMNMVKDRLYCDGNTQRRLSTLFVMDTVFHGMLKLLAPILPYTVDEALFHYNGTGLIGHNFREFPEHAYFDGIGDWSNVYWLTALAGFHEQFNKLKEQGIVKDTLEVLIETENTERFPNMEDWFVVGGIGAGERLAAFQVEDDVFYINKSPHNKCNRCWKRNAKDELCERCKQTVNKD
jgi:isoleucyl-tRNA synthetase